MPTKPADERVALQRVAAAIHALLAGTADPLVHAVTSRDWGRARRALVGAKMYGLSTRGGLGGLSLNSESSLPSELPLKHRNQESQAGDPREETENAAAPRTTWLTPACQHYRLAYGEPPTPVTIHRMARTFKRLEEQHPREEVQRRYGHYVRATPIKFYSVEHFADTWPRWAVAQADERRNGDDPYPGESVDSYASRLARGRP